MTANTLTVALRNPAHSLGRASLVASSVARPMRRQCAMVLGCTVAHARHFEMKAAIVVTVSILNAISRSITTAHDEFDFTGRLKNKIFRLAAAKTRPRGLIKLRPKG